MSKSITINITIAGYSLEGRLKARFFQCAEEDTPLCCSSEVQDAIEHMPGTATQLGGYFTLQYPTDISTCKACKHSTGPISAFVNAQELEMALQQLELVDEVKVVITESLQHEEYKVNVQSGIVGLNRNFYIHFVQNQLYTSNLIDTPVHSTSFSGDIPLLLVNEANLEGTPTRDSAHSNDYKGKVIEIVTGTDVNHGGTVKVAASSSIFRAKILSLNISQSHCSKYCAVIWEHYRKDIPTSFWGIGASFDGTKSGLIETVSISKYIIAETGTADNTNEALGGVTCMTPASLKPQYVHVAVVSNEDVSTMKQSLPGRAMLFRYHQEIEITSFHPLSSPT